jgi:hypothetical protein
MFRRAFRRWGLPGGLRVDNGHPWGLNFGLPPDLALWLIGLGVEMNWNPPGRPQVNGKVERCNGVTRQWAEPSRCGSRSELQERLDLESLIQREHYPSIGGKARIEAFPGLKEKRRVYERESEDEAWDLSRVDRFLAGQILYRVANERGAIWLYGRGHTVGRPHRGQEVRVRFESTSRQWVASDNRGCELKRRPALELTRERILALDVGARHRHRQESEETGETSSRVGGET